MLPKRRDQGTRALDAAIRNPLAGCCGPALSNRFPRQIHYGLAFRKDFRRRRNRQGGQNGARGGP
jgi:hypothetical protein